MGFIYGFESLLKPVNSFWYLLALIVWRLTARYLARFKYINVVLIAIALFAGFFSSIDNTLSIARIICFYPYYMAGYLLDVERAGKMINYKYYKRCLIGIVIAFFSLIVSLWAYKIFSYSDSALQMNGYFGPFDSVGRLMLYLIASLFICSLLCTSPVREIPLLSKFGKNSLWIFIFHRPFTLLISKLFPGKHIIWVFFVSLLMTFVICMIFGSDWFSKLLNKFAELGALELMQMNKGKFSVAKAALIVVACLYVLMIIKDSYSGVSLAEIKSLFAKGVDVTTETETEEKETDIIYPIMSEMQEEEFDDAFRITFAGDLILLEDQVKLGFKNGKYNYDEVFEYAKDYISSADYAIGVFEGPMAGEKAGFSTSNYDDGKELYLNFPDEFGEAVKNAGFDLVTTANNHVLDKGVDGAVRTLDVLDKIQLDHTGSYRSNLEKQKNHIKIVNCSGIKMAILSYTYGSNYIDNSILLNGELQYLTSLATGSEGEAFEYLKESVENDFRKAKEYNPDLIIVLPHWGTQFSNYPDDEQIIWNDIFIQNGADIILGDHPHVVEPAFIEEIEGKDVLVAYSPGNFANVYRENQGDTSVLIDVFINRKTKKIIGGGIVPLYTEANANGNYRALPIYEMLHNEELRKQISTDDLSLAENANDIITNVNFGMQIPITSLQERYYFAKEGFLRRKVKGLNVNDEMKSARMYQALSQADSVCFLGDSLTEGTKNGGVPWYEPIETCLAEKKWLNYSKGGCTVSYLIENANSIPMADLYVVAIGTNDVRYRNDSICAMNENIYIERIEQLKTILFQKNKNAKFVFIAPWYSTDGDPYSALSFGEKKMLNELYAKALEDYCKKNDLVFVNPNPFIEYKLSTTPQNVFLLDHIHPNATEGVLLYSEAVLRESNY